MCVLPEETPCSNGKIKSGNSNKHTFEKEDIESPNTAPDAAASIISLLNNSGNLYHQTLHRTTSAKTDTTLQLSTTPLYVQSTTNQTILSDVITPQVRFMTWFMELL
jgi:hypothetical protein